MALKYLSDIQSARDPQQPTDVANKQYVDAVVVAGGGGTSSGGAYSANLSAGTTATVTHGLGTTDVTVAIYKLSDGLEIEVPFVRTSTNVVTLYSTVDLAGHRVVVLSSGGSSGGGTTFTRTTTAFTTASLATNAAATGTVTLAAGYRLLSIMTSRAARVRLYTTAAKRDADVARAVGTDPTGDHGVMLDYVTTTGVGVGTGAGLGPDQTSLTTETPTSEEAIGGNYSWGNIITFAQAGQISALRCYRGSGETGVSTHTLRLWTTGGVLLDTATTATESGAGWKTVTLGTPRTVTAGQSLKVTMDVSSASNASALFVSSGTITHGDLSRSGPTYSAGTGVYPTNTATSDLMVDVVFQTTPSGGPADLSPTVDGFDGKSTPDGVIYYSVTNLGGAGTVTSTFKWIRTE